MADDTHIISGSQLSAEISTRGAEIHRLTLGDGRELLWDGDPEWWRYRAPLLFPIVGAPPEGHVSVEGRRFPMGQHGFARTSDFALIAAEPDSLRLQLTDSDSTRAGYPFAFALTITHRIAGSTWEVLAEVENRDSRPMPFGFGYHPAFRWPLPGAEGGHMVTLENGAEPLMCRLVNGVRLNPERLASPFSAGRLRPEPQMFEAGAMIFPEGTGDRISYSGSGNAPILRISTENLPMLGIWTKPGAPFLCIEPWHGMAAWEGTSDAIEERPGTIMLPAGESRSFGMAVTVEL